MLKLLIKEMRLPREHRSQAISSAHATLQACPMSPGSGAEANLQLQVCRSERRL